MKHTKLRIIRICMSILYISVGHTYNFLPLLNRIDTQRAVHNTQIKQELRQGLYTKLSQAKSNPKVNQLVLNDILQTINQVYLSGNKQGYPSTNVTTYTDTIADDQTLRDHRLQWHNEIRSEHNLPPLVLNEKLNQTARARAQYLSKNNINAGKTHMRPGTTAYYDYNGIIERFAEQGVFFQEQNAGNVFSESVGFNYVKCSQEDCTQQILTATQKTRNMFVKEKSYNGPHYRAIIAPGFTQVGIDVQYNPETRRYYIVLHYATHIQE